MRLLITGCGHSGTHWIRDILKKAGYGVGHEQACTHGGWNWKAAQDIEVSWCAGAFLDEVSEDVEVWQLTRHPLHVASTFYRNGVLRHGNSHRELVDRALNLDPSRPEMDYWLRWNRLVQVRATKRWRVEDIGPSFVDAVNTLFSRPSTGVDINPPRQRGHIPMDWKGYKRADELVTLTQDYGYELEG